MTRLPDSRDAGSAAAYQKVMDAIVTQKLAPGDKVSENVLTGMFGISRTIARNLLERLVAQQFLVTISPRITRVAPLTLLEIKQNFALRKLLIPELAALSAQHLDIERLFKVDEKMAKMIPVKNENQSLKLLKLNKQFNLMVSEHAPYPLMVHWAHQLEDMTMRIYWLYLQTHHRLPLQGGGHSGAITAIKTGDVTKIQSSITEMITQTEEMTLGAIFSNPQFNNQNLIV